MGYSKRKLRASDIRTLWLSRVVLWIVIILVLFPALWILMSSFSVGDSFFLSSLFPEKLSLEHYVELFEDTDFTTWVWNSLKMCLAVALIQLPLTALLFTPLNCAFTAQLQADKVLFISEGASPKANSHATERYSSQV